ncbi:MAG: hypothetical protein KKG47_01285 [Proteobacteria bacterium]|nr:hypothetical protein [Pseudomonadota bacterium]MBU1736700.1 hypothetical protein [Pseudomonadota bacterium]
MMKQKTGPTGKEGTLVISLDGMAEGVSPPEIAVYLVRKGKVVKKLATVSKNSVPVDKSWLKTAKRVALGPDVDELKKLEADSLLNLRIEDLFSREIFEIPKEWWDKWIFRRVCVSGTVRKCFPSFGPILNKVPGGLSGRFSMPIEKSGCCGSSVKSASRAFNLKATALDRPGLIRWPQICRPVCHGVVEVYETCCNLELPPFDLCDILPLHPDCLPLDLCRLHPEICLDPCLIAPELCGGLPEIGPIDPVGPVIRPEIGPLDPIASKILKQVRAEVDPVIMARKVLPTRVLGDLKTMARMDANKSREYVMDRPYLYPIFFDCSTRKVGEAILRPDGSFTHCYWTSKKPCFRTTYAFKVRQWQDGRWIEVYNGLASGEYFTQDEAKILDANFKAQACQDDPGPEYEKPYVMLQKIGSTDSCHLNSPLQHAAAGINAALPADAGLLNMGYASNCPLSDRLAFRLKMADGIYGTVKARYYRISYAPCDGSGNAAEEFSNLSIPITWRKIVYVDGHFEVEHEHLGPNLPVNGMDGLYTIPDPEEDGWLDSVHGLWDSKSEAGTRYVLKVEIFDKDGKLLKPGISGADFVYLHWTAAETLTPVTHESLVHVLTTNHNICYASIEELRHNLVTHTEDCQFITGQANETISLGYRAYHVKDPVAGTFMWKFNLHWQRGFNGSLKLWDSGGDNRPASLSAGAPALSPAKTLAEMFAGDPSPSPHKKCTFMARLYVYAKHTNGSRRLNEYDDSDFASFALEMTPGGGA